MTQSPIQDETSQLNFNCFGLNKLILQALQEAGFDTPTPIQEQVIPCILGGGDLIGQAQTGTGKTAAFGLPALHMIAEQPGKQILVMTPTRELAKQVSDEIYRFGKYLGIRTAIICGGKSSKMQTEALRRGAQVIVATPGRLLDLLQSQQLPDFNPSIVILDEADEMLDMGFLDDIKLIFSFLPQQRQTLLFSATMPVPIQQLAKEILNKPHFFTVTRNETTNQDIKQFYYLIREEERDCAIVRLIDTENPKKAIIFCKTKKDVDRLASFLSESGHKVKGLHGDMEQTQREQVIRSFRSEYVQILVATDVAARGLNVSDISHVFNYHLPFDPASYVHRIGRTGRAGNKGIASTFVTMREWRGFQRYEKILGTVIHKGRIPTLQEVKQIKHRHLIDQILSHVPNDEAARILKIMNTEDLSSVATKLISLMLVNQAFVGPEVIGLDNPGPAPEKRRGAAFNQRYAKRPASRGSFATNAKPAFRSFNAPKAHASGVFKTNKNV